MIRRFLPLLAGLSVAACATPSISFVDAVSPPEGRDIAGSIASICVAQLHGGRIALVPTPGDQASNTVTSALERDLRAEGFTLATEAKGAHRLAYLVTPLDNGTLVRVRIDDNILAARFLANSAGRLIPDGPETVGMLEASR